VPPLLIFPCTIKSRSSLLALAHPGRPGKRAVKQLWCVQFRYLFIIFWHRLTGWSRKKGPYNGCVCVSTL